MHLSNFSYCKSIHSLLLSNFESRK
ncbi:MAG: hypothetical protein HY305_06440 [Sphingobacteriales bacterium]|nr:hypothetical protein [Sphingobacteriales bacterium]